MSKQQPQANANANTAKADATATPETGTSTASTAGPTLSQEDVEFASRSRTEHFSELLQDGIDSVKARTERIRQINEAAAAQQKAGTTQAETVTSIPVEAIDSLKNVCENLYGHMKETIRQRIEAGDDADKAFQTALAGGADKIEEVAKKLRNDPTASVNPETAKTGDLPPARVRTSTLMWVSALAGVLGAAAGVGAHAFVNRQTDAPRELNFNA